MTLSTLPKYEFGEFCLDPSEHRLLREGRRVPLTPKVFELLRVLVQNAGHLVTKEQLLKEVWPDSFVEEGNLNRAVSVLRKALGESSSERFIETVPKVGYRFVAPVRAQSGAGPVSESSTGVPAEPGLSGVDAPSPGPRSPIRAITSLRAAGPALAAVLVIGAIAFAVVGRSSPGERVLAPTASVHRQLTFTGRETVPTLSPEGTRMAYVSNESPHRKVVVQEVAGAQPTIVFSAPEAGWPRWSPDGSALLFWARGEGRDGLYVAPLAGESPRRIARGPSVACWSPDSSTIAIALFVGQKVRFLDRLGEEKGSMALRGTQGWIWDLDWSPVSDRLLFVANDEQGRAAIWAIRPDGTGQTKVVTANSEIRAARWAPTGDAIYYSRLVNQTISIYKASLQPDEGVIVEAGAPLISGLEADGTFALSADATRLVYARSPYSSNLWLVEPDDGGDGELGAPQARLAGAERGSGAKPPGPLRTTQLTHGTSLVERPRVSPDGQSIVFNMGFESQAELYTIPAAGGSPTQLTYLNAFSLGGAWSEDGRSVAFASTKGGKARIWTISADGGAPRPLSDGDLSDTFDISWSPGSWLLYQQAGNRNFYVLDPETRQERLLIRNSSVGWTLFAAFSPDGKTIALGWNRPPDTGIWIVNGDGSGERLIHRAVNPSDSNPLPIGWSPDGTAIYAIDGIRAASRGVSVSTGETLTKAKVLRIPVNGGQPTTVVSFPFDEVGSVAMFPDGRRFVCTVYTSQSDVWVVDNFDNSLASGVARASR
jgi:Tol biopolymer transport system component/DNA-binding winged helix-turn-helix (wHTH) protein